MWEAGRWGSRGGDPMSRRKIKRGLQADPAGQDFREAAKTRTCPAGHKT